MMVRSMFLRPSCLLLLKVRYVGAVRLSILYSLIVIFLRCIAFLIVLLGSGSRCTCRFCLGLRLLLVLVCQICLLLAALILLSVVYSYSRVVDPLEEEIDVSK